MSTEYHPVPATEKNERRQEALRWVKGASNLMDNRFRIPGTQIRFGLDAIIGLVPYVGDIAGFAMSGLLVLVMARYGASGMLVLRMLGNVAIDTLVGFVPFLGDIFDVAFKANRRNFKLLEAHYEEGKYQGSAWWFVILVMALLAGMGMLLFYVMIRLVGALGLWMWGVFS